MSLVCGFGDVRVFTVVKLELFTDKKNNYILKNFNEW